jgi:hypothetical protein
MFETIVKLARKALKPFVGIKTPEAKENIEKTIQKALEHLKDTVPFFRYMKPAYEVEYDPETGKAFCSFYMDVPYEEARAIPHKSNP